MVPPKISIITVVYNGANSIGKTIQSVLDQTYQNVELIIIDGGSTDGTIDILTKFNSDKIIWTSEPDQGIYDAMNKGIQKSSGDWIYFLGGDDQFYSDQVLESIFLKPFFEDVDFIYGNVKSDAFKGLYNGEFDYEKLLQKNISHQSIFYHRSIFITIGLYNLKYKTHADWDFNLRCYENRDINIKYLDAIIAIFAKGGVSSNYDLPFLRESLLPRKLEFLKSKKGALSTLKKYDEWWRFLRNSKIRSIADFKDSGYLFEVPDVILSMVYWQKRVPGNLLRYGIISKISMFANYITNINKSSN
ncbi:MAG: glycosyltransferase family 2 protein [Ginsengibacter sp.]